MTDAKAPQIVALVLSRNAPQSLARCVSAITAQTRRPVGIVVVDNASSPPVEAVALPSDGLPIRVIRSDANLGPAGGWAIALRDFVAGGNTHAWVMDDDIVPEPECLDRLWSAVEDDPSSAFASPVSIQPDGAVGRWGSWCGFVISREIVEKVGYPMEEFFWWAEDTEYCYWRIPNAGYPLRFIADAVVHHHAIRQGGDLPTWKYYYESRNMLYYHWHVMHRTGRYPRNFARLVGRAAVRQKQTKLRSLLAIGQGTVDGAFGRLGIRYPIVPLRERQLTTGDKGSRS